MRLAPRFFATLVPLACACEHPGFEKSMASDAFERKIQQSAS